MKRCFTYNSIFCLLILLACNNANKQKEGNPSVSYNYSLEVTGETITYNVPSDVTYQVTTLFPFTDKAGNEYITFQNANLNDILFYKKYEKDHFLKKSYMMEGDKGVGRFTGYWIEDFDRIYLTSVFQPEILRVDTADNIIAKYKYPKTTDGHPLIPHCSMSVRYTPGVIINNKIYISQRVYPGQALSNTYLSATIDTITKEVEKHPFLFPDFLPENIDMNKLNGIEHGYSRCFSGSDFVYSFSYNENIYVASIDHKDIREIPVKSKYIPALKKLEPRPDDMNEGAKMLCEAPMYGNLLYDKYRDVYYRFAYPETVMEDQPYYVDIVKSGRKKFSIIILDKNFNIIGETLFPEYVYSKVFFIDKKGLYISNSHLMNPEFEEDVLSFQCFELKKK